MIDKKKVVVIVLFAALFTWFKSGSDDWGAYVKDDAFSGGKQAQLEVSSGPDSLIFGCTQKTLMLQFAMEKHVENDVGEFALRVDGGEPFIFEYAFLQGKEDVSFVRIASDDYSNILKKLLVKLKSADSEVLVGFRGMHSNYRAKFGVRGVKASFDEFNDACKIIIASND
ncbi:hypothetical protein [Serratia liquefaciens]|uniref:hypothetical protein n=1 Tax=Serratia liquefaciens TaxID=614 RepID=UPI0039064CFC